MRQPRPDRRVSGAGGDSDAPGDALATIDRYGCDARCALADANGAMSAIAAAQAAGPKVAWSQLSAADDGTVEAIFTGHKIEMIWRYLLAQQVELRQVTEAAEALGAQRRATHSLRFKQGAPPGGAGCRRRWVVALIFAAAVAAGAW